MESKIKELCRYFNGILRFRDYIEIPNDTIAEPVNTSRQKKHNAQSEFKDAMSFYISQNEFLSGEILLNESDESKEVFTDSQTNLRLSVIHNWTGKRDKNNTSSLESSEDVLIDVILIPKIVKIRVENYPERSVLYRDGETTAQRGSSKNIKNVSLIYIKAKYNLATNEFLPIKGESIIWAHPLLVDRSNASADSNLSLFDFKISDESLEDKDTWQDYTSMVDMHYFKCTGQYLFESDYLTDNHGQKHRTYKDYHKGEILVMSDDAVFASHNIERLYENIAKCGGKGSTLFQTMSLGCKKDYGYFNPILQCLNGFTPQRKIYQYQVGDNLFSHLGQMKRNFPLADAQRQVVHAVTEMHDGQVLSVSGPPGTGKTTVLQSVVAQLLVDSTLKIIERKDVANVSPLKIIASSANNQAITNIIDAFAESNDSENADNLYTRWIRYESGKNRKSLYLKYVPMATYFPSANKTQEAKDKYFISDTKAGMHYNGVKRYFIQNPFVFVGNAMKGLGMKFYEKDPAKAIGKIQAHLRERILLTLKRIKFLVNLSNKRFTTVEMISETLSSYGYSVAPIQKQDSKESAKVYADKLLDKTLRYEMYWLSVHYNECLWMQKILLNNKVPSESIEPLCGKELLDELCFLSPCVVATFYSVPKLFLKKSEDKSEGEEYDYNAAELLIVDESGQVSPEIGFATFSLARKAIVVGDIHQIPPVKSLSQYYTERIWNQCVSKSSKSEQQELFISSKSSIMSIAMERSCVDRAENARGLFLNEHRRCVDEIIKYCNNLIYNGELTPKRGSIDNLQTRFILPAMGIYNTNNPCLSKNGSRYNYGDSKAIVQWLESNENAIRNAYAKDGIPQPLSQLVVIITPFRAQSESIKSIPFISNNGIRVGTVHTFQGAESPIVIFSFTYGGMDDPLFVKDNIELMNVAVSRAKDHFLVFGSKYCLQKNVASKSCELLLEMSSEVFPQI